MSPDCENNGKNNKKLKITKWQVGGTIAVTLMGAYVTWSTNQSASDDELKKTISEQRSMLNKQETMIAELKVLIPQIKEKFDGHEGEFSKLDDIVRVMDKKVSKLEGILETMLRKVRIDDIEDMLAASFLSRKPKKESKGFLDKIGFGDKKEKKKPKKRKTGIRTLKMQQRILPSLDSPIVKEKK